MVKTQPVDGQRYCRHCTRETDYHLTTSRLYGVSMPDKICNECGFAVNFTEPPTRLTAPLEGESDGSVSMG